MAGPGTGRAHNRNITKTTEETCLKAGLFDYFNDKSFEYILQKFASWLKPNGKIIVGNFSVHNPSRDYMELFGEWYLNHRTHSQLLSLANEAGFAIPNVSIEEEEEGVNLFLNIQPNAGMITVLLS